MNMEFINQEILFVLFNELFRVIGFTVQMGCKIYLLFYTVQELSVGAQWRS